MLIGAIVVAAPTPLNSTAADRASYVADGSVAVLMLDAVPGLQRRQVTTQLTAALPGSVYVEFFVLPYLAGCVSSSVTATSQVVGPLARRLRYKSALFIFSFLISVVLVCSSVPGVIYASSCVALIP